MPIRRVVLLVAATASLAGLSACGDDDTEPVAAATPTVPAWDTTPPARERDAERAEPSRPGRVAAPVVGRWRQGSSRLVLRADGSYTTSDERDGTAHGFYRARGRTLVFGHDDACQQGGYEGRGTYRWAVRDGALRIDRAGPEEGGCTGRSELLTGRAWRAAR